MPAQKVTPIEFFQLLFLFFELYLRQSIFISVSPSRNGSMTFSTLGSREIWSLKFLMPIVCWSWS